MPTMGIELSRRDDNSYKVKKKNELHKRDPPKKGINPCSSPSPQKRINPCSFILPCTVGLRLNFPILVIRNVCVLYWSACGFPFLTNSEKYETPFYRGRWSMLTKK